MVLRSCGGACSVGLVKQGDLGRGRRVPLASGGPSLLHCFSPPRALASEPQPPCRHGPARRQGPPAPCGACPCVWGTRRVYVICGQLAGA